MKTYFADTNFYLRFLLQDNQTQAAKVEYFLKLAKKEKIKIVYLPAIILEMEFVLRHVYTLPKSQISSKLLNLIKTPYLTVEDRGIWVKAFELFNSKSIALLDVFLLEKAKANNAEILSFDKKLLSL